MVYIKMTLTAPNCPVAGSLPQDVQTKVSAIPGVQDVKVDLVFDPPWDRSKMSQAAKLQLGML
jgi:metal-sulfur cluster biosynthetic enzyme